MFRSFAKEPGMCARINNRLFLAADFLAAVLLAAPMFRALPRHFTDTSFCGCLILVLLLLNYLFAKSNGKNAGAGTGITSSNHSWKSKARVFAWAVLIATVALVGFGPIINPDNPSAYAVDKFPRILGLGVINNYSVSKKVHYFYFALVIYGLLIFCLYQNIVLSLMNNLHSRISGLVRFSDTLLFVGYSFLLVCVYRQFSSQYSYDLTLYFVKTVMIFMMPAFYLWQTGKLRVQDIRTLLALLLLSLVLSLNIVIYFDTRDSARFSSIFAVALFASLALFVINRKLKIFNDGVFYSKITVLSLIFSLSVVFFSLFLEFSNILALKTGSFFNVEKVFHFVFYFVCWLSVIWLGSVRKVVSRKTAEWVLLIFVLGVSLILNQPPLVIGADLDIFEGANYAVPISDFFNYGKIPLFENFPGHNLSEIISSVIYGTLTSDYRGALCAPWYLWLYSAVFVVILYCFIKSISNGLVAVSSAILLPYLLRCTSEYGIGLSVLLPFFMYIRTLRKRYLVLTVLLTFFIIAYRLDIGYSFLAGVILSSILVSIIYRNKIIYKVILSFALGGLAVLGLFLITCLVKDINPIARIHEYLAVASSNDHWGINFFGDAEKNSYSFVYFVLPALSVLFFIIAIACRRKFNPALFAVLLCLIFAYYANIPRLLVRHNLSGYMNFPKWLWTIPIAMPFLISMLVSKNKSAFILCETTFVLIFYVFYQNTTFYDNSALQNTVNKAGWLSDQVNPDARKRDTGFVFGHRSRVAYNESGSDNLILSNQLKKVADMLLSPDETYLDFTNQTTTYAWTGRRNPAFIVQSPAMLSGEVTQREFIREIESDITKVPIVIMPTENGRYLSLHLDGINNNIRHYLVAEWIYNNYRPFIKYNSFTSVWVLNSRYDEFYKKLKSRVNGVEFDKPSSAAPDNKFKISLIDWGYDNFVSLPVGAFPDAEHISIPHDYSLEFLPYIWGQFDSKDAASHTDLAKISRKGDLYSWNYAGKENKPAYLRVDLSAGRDFLKQHDTSYLILGNTENGKFTPLNRQRFKLRKGKKVYLFRISSDYYWSRGSLNALSLDSSLGGAVDSVRILEGD